MSELNIYGREISVSSKKTSQSSGWAKLIGLGYPIVNIKDSSHFYRQSNVSIIKGNLKQLLLTEQGERVMLPEYGLSLRRFLFQPLDKETFELIKEEIVFNIAKYVPGVLLKRVRVVPTLDIGNNGQNAFLVQLLLTIREEPQTLIDLEVKIG